MCNSWILELKKENKVIIDQLITKNNFVERLEILLKQPECPILAIQYEIISPKPFEGINIRIPKRTPKEIPFNKNIMMLEDNRNSKCYIRIWKKTNSLAISTETVKLAKCLLKNYWKAYFRTLPTGLIDIKRSLRINTIAKSTFSYILNEQSMVSLLYCDIDNFKKVSLEYGIKNGDIVLKEVGAILESLTIDNTILLHNGGDEFLILVAGNSRIANKLAEGIKRVINGHTFSIDSIHLDISIGISSTYGDEDFDTILESSNKAMLNAKREKNNSYRR